MRASRAKRTLATAAAALFAAGAICLVAGGAALASPSAAEGAGDYFDGRLVQKWGQEGPVPAYPGMTVERDARAVNEGSAVMAARMRFEKSWGSLEDGAWTACDDGSLDESLIEVELPEGSGWVDGGDGWYYYERPVNPGESTNAFISTCSISEHVGEDAHVGEASAYSGKAARVDVYLECAQAFQESADGPAESASSGGGQVVHRLPRSVTAAFAPKTGDGALAGFALCAAACALTAVSVILLALALRRGKDDDSPRTVPL